MQLIDSFNCSLDIPLMDCMANINPFLDGIKVNLMLHIRFLSAVDRSGFVSLDNEIIHDQSVKVPTIQKINHSIQLKYHPIDKE